MGGRGLGRANMVTNNETTFSLSVQAGESQYLSSGEHWYGMVLGKAKLAYCEAKGVGMSGC